MTDVNVPNPFAVQSAPPVDLSRDATTTEVASASEAILDATRRHAAEIEAAFVDALDESRPISTRLRAAEKLLEHEARIAKLKLDAQSALRTEPTDAEISAMSKQELADLIMRKLADLQDSGVLGVVEGEVVQ
jgi:hypothetical protein